MNFNFKLSDFLFDILKDLPEVEECKSILDFSIDKLQNINVLVKDYDYSLFNQSKKNEYISVKDKCFETQSNIQALNLINNLPQVLQINLKTVKDVFSQVISEVISEEPTNEPQKEDQTSNVINIIFDKNLKKKKKKNKCRLLKSFKPKLIISVIDNNLVFYNTVDVNFLIDSHFKIKNK